METKNLADLEDLPPLDWTVVADRLDAGFPQAPGTGGPDRHTCWLTTLDPDGRPHVTGIGTLWIDGHFWFETGARTRKGRNISRDPRCALSLAVQDFDVVVNGTAILVTEPATVARMAAAWAEDGWPARVDGTGTALTADFSAPSAGPPPWHVYRIDAHDTTALATSGAGGATRWTW